MLDSHAVHAERDVDVAARRARIRTSLVQPLHPSAASARLTCGASRSSAAAEPEPAAAQRPDPDARGDAAGLDDALRLGRQGAGAEEVTLDITRGVPHVFQAYYRCSTKRPRRWTEPDKFVSAHLAGAHQVPRKAETVLSS